MEMQIQSALNVIKTVLFLTVALNILILGLLAYNKVTGGSNEIK